MARYDGWVLKSPSWRKSKGLFIVSFFHRNRNFVIKQIDKTVAVGYKKWKKDGGRNYEIVKVKFVEVA